MASSKRPSDSPNATRQMLDELDALMERMLSQPVADMNDPPPPTLAATLTVVPPDADAKGIEPPSKKKLLAGRSLAPSYRTEAPAPVEEAPSSPWTRTEVMPTNEEILPPLPQRPPSPPKEYTGQRRSWSSRILQPLVWINQVYDGFTRWFGIPGRWMRGARGRTILGYLGLILLCLALAWGLRDLLGATW